MVWDRGTWTPEDPAPEEACNKGSLKFTLNGAKLHGRWALVRMANKAAGNKNSRYRDSGNHENWLLIKERDAMAVPDSGSAVGDDNPLSGDTGRAMEAIAADR